MGNSYPIGFVLPAILGRPQKGAWRMIYVFERESEEWALHTFEKVEKAEHFIARRLGAEQAEKGVELGPELLRKWVVVDGVELDLSVSAVVHKCHLAHKEE